MNQKMKMEPMTPSRRLEKGSTVFAFLESGDLFYALSSGCMLNGLRGNPMDGSINNIWLRIHEADGLRVIPLLGIRSESRVSFEADRVIYTGCEASVSWQVTFVLAEEGKWLWDVRLHGCGQVCDLLYGQDIGMGDEGGVLTNELYMAQYLGHTVFRNENGYMICSRQNMGSSCGHPYLQQGMCIGRVQHYSTDGTQFFGLGSKCGEAYPALSGDLPDVNLQYELSYTGLQSEPFTLDGTAEMAFYGIFLPDHPDAVRAPELEDEKRRLAAAAAALPEAQGSLTPVRPCIGREIVSRTLTETEIEALFSDRRLEEKKDGRLLSFFCGSHTHVVLQEKERICERPHAVIHINPVNPEKVDFRVMASTAHMCGVFMSQVIVGNTNSHKLISTVRNPLNLLHNSGLRLYLRRDGLYHLLTMPAAFEMGVSYAKWYYALEDDILTVTVFTAADAPAMVLEAESRNGRAYDLCFTAQLLFGSNEYEAPVTWTEENGVLTFDGEKAEPVAAVYPDLCYRLIPEGEGWHFGDDRAFFPDGCSRNGTLFTLSVSGRSQARFTLQGCLYGEAPEKAAYAFPEEKEKAENAFRHLTRGLHLDLPDSEEVEKLNETLWWYTHNAMIHFASPHGIEQPGGAAWGTRDVCQGPMEYFLALGHFDLARDVLCRIFSHQFRQNREWPQWFMFDGYPYSAGECHGDVVFWPLKALSDYLARTGDLAVLQEVLPYTEYDTNLPGEEKASLLNHVKAAVNLVETTRLVGDTALVSYAGGDWDDTLQPADPATKEKLISAWTVALAYQTFHALSCVLEPADPQFSAHLLELSERMKKDFNEKLIQDGVIAGFGLYENGEIRMMLHPRDENTGVHYRLLPQTRSIIAEMVDEKQAAANMALIDEHLLHPDGVRLMDRPVAYDGGVSHLFQRAEQAANVGREISLQYVHAHIRYIEACAKAGLADRAWQSLFVINPIKISDVVKNALPRQSNLYFSSSEGCFRDRYEYSRDFDKLRDGSIDVKGGWRLYSSGPGIYTNQLVSHILGIRIMGDGIVLDPVLPKKLDGLEAEITLFGRTARFVYRFGGDRIRVEKDGAEISSAAPDCSRGCTLKKDDFGGVLDICLPE
ncbi:MAG: GH36-type glycosyl hydrolase domain-containing protein [Hominenteromicrobium sp.]